MIVVGDKEVQDGTVSVRSRKGGDLGAKNAEAFAKELKEEISIRAK
jgi:threonyl-tRNA synthetase